MKVRKMMPRNLVSSNPSRTAILDKFSMLKKWMALLRLKGWKRPRDTIPSSIFKWASLEYLSLKWIFHNEE